MNKLLHRKLWLAAVMLLVTAFNSLAQNYNVTTAPQCNTTAAGNEIVNFTGVTPNAIGNGTVVMYFKGDFDGKVAGNEYMDLYGETGPIMGNTTQSTTGISNTQCATAYDSIVVSVPMASINAWAADGTISFTADGASGVSVTCPAPGTAFCVYMRLEYPRASGLNDIGVSSIDTPSVFCAGLQNIWVTVKNYGLNQVNSAIVNWTWNGVLQSPVNITQLLDTAQGLNPNFLQLMLGSKTITNADTIVVWTSAPNSGVDTVNVNDTITRILAPSLSGNYTINAALPASGTNYQSFTTLVSHLAQYGICGPIVVDVSGSYTQQVVIPQIAGSSSSNTITFNGTGDDTLSFGGTTTRFGTLNLDGADYVTFNNLVFRATGATNSFAVHLSNSADNNTFDSCVVIASPTATATTTGCVMMSGSPILYSTAGANGSNNTFSNCKLNGGYFGFSFYGSTTAGNSNNKILNCTATNYYIYGAYLLQQGGGTVANSIFERPTRTALSTFYGVFLTTGCTNMLVEKNIVRNPAGGAPSTSFTGYPIYCSSAATLGNENKIFNNVVGNINGIGVRGGIYLTGATYVQVYHNTVVLDHTAASVSTMYGIYATGTAGVDIKNNNVVITQPSSGIKYGLYFTGAGKTSNNNNIYVNGGGTGANNVGYFVSAFATLPNWQAANGGIWDQNSAAVDPLFVNVLAGDFTPSNSLMDNIGTPLGIATDINGAARSVVTPDAGAYEFSVAGCSGSPTAGSASVVGNVTSACIGAPLSLSLAGFTLGSGISIQWEESPAGAGVWSAITGATSSSPGVTLNGPTDYRAVVTCANGGGFDVSNTVGISINPFYLCYCSPNTGVTLHGTTANYITNVNIPTTSLNVTTSVVGGGGFTQHDPATPANTATLIQGLTYTLNAAITSASYQSEVWVDWDQSGSFDSTEYFLLPASTTPSVQITVPATAVTGLTGMRIRNTASTATLHGTTGACINIANGRETEDFVINVAAGVQCSGTPAVTGNISANDSSICNGLTVALSLSGFPQELGIAYQWESSPSGLNTFTPISGATGFTYSSAALSADIDYRVAVTCTNTGGGTAYTNILTIFVNNPQILTSSGATRCGVGTVNLSATASIGSQINWYANASGGAPLASNTPTFTTPVISNTTTYYAAAGNGSQSQTSAMPPTLPNVSTTTVGGLVIDINQALVLNSVNVFSINAGTVSVELRNSAGALIAGPTVFPLIASTYTNPQNLQLNWSIPPGTGYRLLATPSVALAYQGGTYPLPLGNGAGNIVNGAVGTTSTSTLNYYFYNLQTSTGCEGTRVPVTATVTTAPAYTITATPDTICMGSSSTVAVSSTNAYTYTWAPNGTGSSFSASPNATTKYYLSGTDANNCNIIDSVTVHVKSAPATAAALATPSSICVSGSTNLSLNPAPMFGIGIQWEKNTGSGFTAISGATGATYSDVVNATASYRALLYCNSNLVTTSDPDTVILNNPTIAQTFPGSRCGMGPVTLAATGTNGAVVNWYANATGGSSLATGNAFTTPSISTSTTYYAAPSFGSGSGNAPELMYFKFDGSSTTVPNEGITPLSSTGTIGGSLSQGGTGQFGGALMGSLAGASDIFNTNAPLNLTGSWSMSMWFSGIVSSTTIKYLFGTSSAGASAGFRCFTGGAAGAGNITVRGGTNMTNVAGNGIFDVSGSPVVVTIVYDSVADAIIVYKDGAFVSNTAQTTAAPVVVNTATDNFLLLPTGVSGLVSNSEKLDEFRFYNRALTASEIASTWNVTLGGCEGTRVPVTATINPAASGTGLATGGTTTGASQGASTVQSYTDACNDTVAVVASGSTALGTTSAIVLTSSTVQTHQNKPFVPRAYDIAPATNGPATVTLYALQSEFTAYNSYVTSNSLALPLLPTGPTDVAGMSNVVITQYHGSASAGNQGPLGLYSNANVSFIQNSAITVTPIGSYWKLTFPVTGFSGFFIHTGATPLAIDLKNITAVNVGSRNRIDWSTASEASGDRFELERSIDGSFVKLADINAKGQPSAYSYWDETPVTGVNYYRIKMVDAAGRFSYSKTVNATVKSGTFTVQAYPNPVGEMLTVQVFGEQGADARISINDITGKLIRTIAVTADKTLINMSGMAQGMYLIQYTDATHSQTIKVNKQ